VRVYVFGSELSYRLYRPQWNPAAAGYFLGLPYGRYLVIGDQRDRETSLHVVYHEYVHHLLRHHPTPLPLWYHDGLAEIFASFRVVDGSAQVGLPLGDRLTHLAERGWGRSKRLFEIDSGSEEYRSRWTGFHAQAWALAHYFLFGDARRRAQLEVYLAHMDKGARHAEAYALAFDVDEDALWSDVVDHIRAEEFRFGSIPVDELAIPSEQRLRSLPEPEVAYLLGDLFAQLGPAHADDARKLLERALASDRDHAEAHASMVLVDDYQKRYAEARVHQKRAVAAVPDSFRVQMISGDHHYSSFLRQYAVAGHASNPLSPGLRRQLALARGHYAQAIHLNRRVPEAYDRYGRTYLFGSDPPRKGEEMLVAARRSWPRDRKLAATLALLHLRSGQAVEARQVLASTLRSDPESDAVARWLEVLTATLDALPASPPASPP
jgi:tetratricopeptide (TPR) repeat protein